MSVAAQLRVHVTIVNCRLAFLAFDRKVRECIIFDVNVIVDNGRYCVIYGGHECYK